MKYFEKVSGLRVNFKGQLFNSVPGQLPQIEKLKAVVKNNAQMKKFFPETILKTDQQVIKSLNQTLGRGWNN